MHAERLRASRPDDLPLEAVTEAEPNLGERARVLVALADAMQEADPVRIEPARRHLGDVTDEATVIDAVGVIAAFWGFNLVADATGCGLGADEASTAEVRRRLDLDRFAPPD